MPAALLSGYCLQPSRVKSPMGGERAVNFSLSCVVGRMPVARCCRFNGLYPRWVICRDAHQLFEGKRAALVQTGTAPEPTTWRKVVADHSACQPAFSIDCLQADVYSDIPFMKEKCLNPECELPEYARGLCHCCYRSALRLVDARRTTWKALEKAGKSRRVVGRTHVGRASWLLK